MSSVRKRCRGDGIRGLSAWKKTRKAYRGASCACYAEMKEVYEDTRGSINARILGAWRRCGEGSDAELYRQYTLTGRVVVFHNSPGMDELERVFRKLSVLGNLAPQIRQSCIMWRRREMQPFGSRERTRQTLGSERQDVFTAWKAVRQKKARAGKGRIGDIPLLPPFHDYAHVLVLPLVGSEHALALYVCDSCEDEKKRDKR